jgi:hypothetical protein
MQNRAHRASFSVCSCAVALVAVEASVVAITSRQRLFGSLHECALSADLLRYQRRAFHEEFEE